MKVSKYPTADELSILIQRPSRPLDNVEDLVKEIIEQVKTKGDAALREFTEKFDGATLQSLYATSAEFETASTKVQPELRQAIQTATANIQAFHAAQNEDFMPLETMPGIRCWRKSIAIERVGLYIPGGTAPLFSTVLMLGIPAQIAGCKEIILFTPPDSEGKINPAILYAAQSIGITRVVKAGGAQAIAAMAYGTESIPKVDKIFGPGNRYVTAAKMLVQKDGVAIDMPAGPSEVLVYADEGCNPVFVASDLLAQAEHDVDAQAMLLTTSENVLEEVVAEVARQCELLPRQHLMKASLSHSVCLLLRSKNEVLQTISQYAPEHLILACEDAEDMAEDITQAGSVFIGNFTPESAGDYASGTNHTLPTNGFARSYSGVSLDSFVRKITFQQMSLDGLKTLAPTIITMAEAEQLPAHAASVRLRLQHQTSEK
jgi:histidinol dehydrogenase